VSGDFDVLIVGAGPAATAALIGIDQRARLGIVTGSTFRTNVSTKDIHAKIRAVADSRKEMPGVLDPIAISGRTHPAVSTAIIGGLANYWGQQFIRYISSEEWPRQYFDGYDSYQASCSQIEAEFFFDESNGPSELNQTALGAYQACSPRLLIGTKVNLKAGLGAMRQVIEQKLIDRGATKIDDRVDSLIWFRGRWKARLSGGNVVSARRIVLAAGVLGTASLLMRSFAQIQSVLIHDHSPLWLYAFGMNKVIRTTRKRTAPPHFNVQTLQKETDEGFVLFASVYNIRYAELNLISNMLIGKSISAFAGLRAPWPANWINRVQVWTKSTTITVCIERSRNAAHVIHQPNFETDAELCKFKAAMRDHNVSIVKINGTPPLQGYHFHGLEISTDNYTYVPIKEFLNQCSSGSLICVDASVLNQISCRPHTETVMATATRSATTLR
jgi:hypothetical protein